MTEFLLLGHSLGTHELRSILLQAGYEVIELGDIAALRDRTAEPAAGAPPAAGRAARLPLLDEQLGIAIVDPGGASAGHDGRERDAQLRERIISLARQLTPGWRLSMRHHQLEAPNGQSVRLTTMEYKFIKVFALVDAGEAVSRKQIVKAFGEDYLSYDQNRIDTMVRRLRQKVLRQLRVKLPLNTERIRGFSFGDVLIIDP